MDSYILIGVYWRARSETCEACAERLKRVFDLFSDCEGLDHFFWQANSREESLASPLSTKIESLSHWLRSSPGRGKRLPIDTKIGWSNACWNGASDADWAELRVRCGVVAESLGNAFTLKLGSAVYKKLIGAELNILRSLIDYWAPDSALITSLELMGQIEMQPGATGIGSLSYLSSSSAKGVPVGLGYRYSNGVIVDLEIDLSLELSPVKVALARELYILVNS